MRKPTTNRASTSPAPLATTKNEPQADTDETGVGVVAGVGARVAVGSGVGDSTEPVLSEVEGLTTGVAVGVAVGLGVGVGVGDSKTRLTVTACVIPPAETPSIVNECAPAGDARLEETDKDNSAGNVIMPSPA